MSKQWGHGYWNGIKQASSNNQTMEGVWFHSFENGKIQWQGKIIKDIKNGSFLVQLYEWMIGDPSVQKIVAFEQMKDWNFYPSAEEMRLAWYKQEGDSEEDIERCERFAKRFERKTVQ
jgi:hypothetical protein